MSGELAQLNAKLDEVLALLRDKPKPHLTGREFAKAANLHPNTVSRWVGAGLIRTEYGRIPQSELKKFVS